MKRALLALTLFPLVACDRAPDAALVQRIDAERLAADMRVQLHRSTGAVQRAIMADTDEASGEFGREAREAADALDKDRVALDAIVADIGSASEQELAQNFGAAFAELRALDSQLLDLAVENTNVKAQRLSFGPAREAAEALRDHLDRAVRSAPAAKAGAARLLAVQTELAVSEIRVLHVPHIAEADDVAMTELEERMAQLDSSARTSLSELAQILGSKGEPQIASTREQLDHFARIHQEIVALSRKNSDVRSLAAALGEKRELTAACDAALVTLQNELAKHEFRATR